MSGFDSPEIYRTVLESRFGGYGAEDRFFWIAGAERTTGYLRQEVVGRVFRENVLAEKGDQERIDSDATKALESVLQEGRSVMAEISLRH